MVVLIVSPYCKLKNVMSLIPGMESDQKAKETIDTR